MKKITLFLVISLVFNIFFIKNETFAEDRTFIVTAYYSPLPWQKYYMRGNLEKEKILQWEWTHGASGKAIFSGMLAAPKTYNFWTKIFLEWLGVWVVEDRGQAIVKKWERWYEHDRLDVWMWYGDEGLKRTLAWWKRKVEWKILPEDAEITIDYKKHPAPDKAVAHLKKAEKNNLKSEEKSEKITEKTIFDFSIWKDSEKEEIIKLQKFLQEKWFYKWKIDWIYNSEIISFVLDFQLKNEIISSKNDFWAWYWWEKTRKIFKEKLEHPDKKIEEKSEKLNIFSNFSNSLEEIKEVEKIFKEIWILKVNETLTKENFSENILKFQISEKIILWEKEIWAWNFWPKTRWVLKKKYENFIDEKILQEKINFEKNKKIEKAEIEAQNLVDEKVKNLKNKIIKKWDSSLEVRELQNILAELWYFSEKSTGFYGEKTFDSVLNFQLENNLIEDKNSEFAWIIWEKTFLKLKENLQKKYLDEILTK